MILAAILALAPAQESPAARPPDPALLDGLVLKTNALPAFVAEYQAHAAGQDTKTSVRILYRAPDHAKIVFGSESIFRIHDGFLDVRATQPGEAPIAARVAIEKPILDRFTRLATAMSAEFPAAADAWTSGGKAGIRFDLAVGETPGTSAKSLQFTASYARPSPARFGWLEDLARKPGAPSAGDRLVFDEPLDEPVDSERMKITLSTSSGFIEMVEVRQPGGAASFNLVALDLSPEIADAAFELPPRPADAVDASAVFAERFQQVQTQNQRKDALACVARLIAEKRIEWDPASRAHLARVLEVIHADAWKLENEVWIGEMRRRMDEFAAWFRDRLRDPELSDDASRKKLEEAVAEWRRSLPLSAATGLDPRLSSLSIDAEVTQDAAMRQDCLAIEREAVRKTMQSALVEPLLRDFDEKIEQARLGK